MKISLFILLLFCFSSITSFSQDYEYDDLINEIHQLESRESYQKAKQLIDANLSVFNDNWFELSKELIYCNEKLGSLEENISIYKEAHDLGYFYFMHPGMPKYRPYMAFENFDSISQKDLQLLREANKNSKTVYEVHLPKNYSKYNKYPLIIILHGGGKNINDVKGHWQTNELNDNYIKVYVQSYRHFDSDKYGWGSDDKRSEQDFKSIYNELINSYSIDTNRIVFGSISAGANPVIEMSLKGVIPVKGFIVFCPSIPNFIKQNKFELIKNKNVKAFIVSGEKDHFIPGQKTMIHILDSLDIVNSFSIVKNMGCKFRSK